MSVQIEGEDGAVAVGVANAAPILNLAAPTLTPTLNSEPVPGLPKELQPDPGDILLARAFWPWEDLGAKDIPEHWLYMGRKIQGVVAQITVQTPAGPRLLSAASDGTLISTPGRGLADIEASTSPAVGTRVSISLPASPGMKWRCLSIFGTLVNIAGPAFDTILILRDGDPGVGGNLWDTTLAVSATDHDKDHVSPSGISITGTPGNAMTLEFVAVIATVRQSASMVAYLENSV